MLKKYLKIGFWSWQFIIAMSFFLFALYIVLWLKIDDNYSTYMSIGCTQLPFDSILINWGILPALSVIAINMIYRFFYKRIRSGSKCNYSSTKSMLVHGLKYIGIFGAILILAFEWFICWVIGHPLHVLITIVVISMFIFNMLKNEHWICWISTIILFSAIGTYFVFNNDLPGPMTWIIADRPIDISSQWLDYYRLFWWGIILNETFQYAGLISCIFLALLKLVKYNIN